MEPCIDVHLIPELWCYADFPVQLELLLESACNGPTEVSKSA